MTTDIITLAKQGAAVDRVGHKPLSQDRWAVPSFYAHQFAMTIMALEA
jgi:hypothetical protein